MDDLKRHAANRRLATGWNAKPRGLDAALREVNAEILRLKEATPQPRTDWKPPRPVRSFAHPCPRCGREQPASQSRDDLAAYRALNPTAVLYVRADGKYRAHDATCDALPHKVPPPPPPVEIGDEDRKVADSTALRHGNLRPIDRWALADVEIGKGWRYFDGLPLGK